MSATTNNQLNKQYVFGVSLITFVLPFISYGVECLIYPRHGFLPLELGKWFIFHAVGFRLTLAGMRQLVKPAFTAKTVFQMESNDSYPVIRELGFANLCFGLIGLLSLFLPGWRMVSAFGSGIYYGLAGLQHSLKKDPGGNQRFALYTDLIIFFFLSILFWLYCN